MFFENMAQYKLVAVNNISKGLIPTINELFKVQDSCNMQTSPWMNRFALMKNGGTVYTIVPSNIPCYGDIVKATKEKFVVFKWSDGDIRSIEIEDENFIIKHFPEQFEESNLLKRAAENLESTIYAAYFQMYRRMFATCKDHTVEMLRTIFTYNRDAAKMIVESLRTEDSLEMMISQDPSMSQFYYDFRKAVIEGNILFGDSYNDVCDLDKVFDDEKHMNSLLKALSPESIRIMREWIEEEKPKLVKLEDIKDTFVDDMLFGFQLHQNKKTGKFLLYKKINKNPLNDPFGCNVTEGFLVTDNLNDRNEAKRFVARMMDYLVKNTPGMR